MKALFASRNFLIYWSIGFLASIGGFFSIVAMPWMVLELYQNNPFIMATVMAVGVLPQTFFIVFGGVISDRFSAIKTVIASRLCSFILLMLFFIFVKLNLVSLWVIYLFAFLIGTSSAIMGPANQSLLTSVVEKNQLHKANSLCFSTTHLSQIFGPLIAGWFIYWSRQIYASSQNYDLLDIYALAFLMDAMILFIVFVLSFFIRVKAQEFSSNKLLDMLREGLAFCKKDEGIKLVLFYIGLVSFLFGGALMACLPVYIKLHLGLTEQHYGYFYTLIGTGTIIGIWLSIILKPSNKQLGALVLVCDLIGGLCLCSLGFITQFSWCVIPLLLMGICSGVVLSAGTTWFQMRTPGVLMGRVMSILVFCASGLVPISASLFGLLLKYVSVIHVVQLAGAIIVFFTLMGLALPKIRMMGNLPSPTELSTVN
jgi:MFS family permease